MRGGLPRPAAADQDAPPSASPGEPVFTAEASSAWVYYVRTDAAGSIDRRSAFVPQDHSNLPLTLSLAESWQIAGVYVFLGRAAAGDAEFLARCRQWIGTSAPAHTTLAWIADPNADPDRWDAPVVRVKARTADGGSLAASARITLRNYALVIAKGEPVRLDAALPGFRLGGRDRSGIQFAVDEGRDTYPVRAGVTAVALRGAERALCACDVDLPAAAADEPSALDRLDAGIRYFHPLPPADGAVDIGSLRFPVFDTRTRALTLRATLDPIDPLGPRSALSFGDEAEPLASYFRTTSGDVVRLRPAGCRLRFTVRPHSVADPSAGSYYLMPSGACEVSAAAAGASLLCGISAAESIELGEHRVALSFVEGCPAFAPAFWPRGAPSAPMPENAPRLSDVALTSWIAIGAVGAPLGYFAQPQRALLYGPPPASSSAPGARLLPFFPVRAAELPAADASTLESTAIAPMAPCAGCDPSIARDVLALEVEVLSHERRDCLVSVAPAPAPRPLSSPQRRPRALRAAAPETGIRAMTPGGWVATFAADGGEWRSLELARIGSQVLALHDVHGPLRSALLANQQFVVISDPSSIAGHFTTGTSLDVDGWRFDLAPGRWAEHGTLMILKSCDRPLAELAQDVAAWTLPESFNADPAQAQRELIAIISEATARVQTEAGSPDGASSGVAHFVHTVLDDPLWNGVLFLRASVPLESLPEDLEGLRPGLDARFLFAHHLGLNQTHVRGEGASLVQENSSVFGLIHYADRTQAPAAPPAPFAFRVLDLDVVVENSAVHSFNSRVVLFVERLFGAHATGHDPRFGSALILTGACQHRGSSAVYVFHNEDRHTFDLADAVLRTVNITRVEMTSSRADASRAAGGQRTTRFTLWGSLEFRPLRASFPQGTFDLFGFDALAFAGLCLSMSYPADAPEAATFVFDATAVTFDPATTRAREQSFPRHFPATPKALTSSAAAAEPGKLGFMPVQMPALDTQPLGPDWFGVVLDLNLGTPGTLSSLVDLTATVGLFWSPDPQALRIMTGLKLPGSTGRNELSLMGVLKLSIYSTQLLCADGAFLLKLTGVTLKLMGKSLPPAGDFQFFVFGDPAPQAKSTSLGWYAAYRKPKPPPPAEPEGDHASRRFAARHLLEPPEPAPPARTTARRSVERTHRTRRRARTIRGGRPK